MRLGAPTPSHTRRVVALFIFSASPGGQATNIGRRARGGKTFVKSLLRKQVMSAPIVVVTGANRGIGFEISRQLATRGAQVTLTARKLEAGKAAVKKLAAQNLTVQFRPLDVTSSKSIIALREFLKRTYGRIDVLINNAGIIAKGDAPGLEVDLETVHITLETNALGPFHL